MHMLKLMVFLSVFTAHTYVLQPGKWNCVYVSVFVCGFKNIIMEPIFPYLNYA